MESKPKQFKVGDKVFAKIRGYPAWPAIILEEKNRRFIVRFYGTDETGTVGRKNLFDYLEHRDRLNDGSKRKKFRHAIEEIEDAIAQAGGTDGSNETVNEENVNGTGSQMTQKTEDNKSTESEQGMSTAQKTEVQLVNKDNINLTETNNIQESEVKVSIVELISEQTLKHWIIYANYVKDHPNLYKTVSSYSRDYSEYQCIPVLLQTTKQYIGLRLHRQWPLQDFQNEYENALYDKMIAENLLKFKRLIENNEINIDNVDKHLYLDDLNITEEIIERYFEYKTFINRQKLIERCQNESRLLELDARIRCSLKTEKAETQNAIDALKEMSAFEFYDEIMLKKHPHLVETIFRVCRFTGNINGSNLSDEEKDNLNKDSKLIRKLADSVFKKFQNILKLSEDITSFCEEFNDLIEEFDETCADLSTYEIFRLTDEPYARASFIDRLQQKDLSECTDHKTEQAEQ